MKLPPIDLTYIAQCFDECGRDLVETWSDNAPQQTEWTTPELVRGMHRLILALCRLEEDRALERRPEEGKELKVLGEHGLQMLSELSRQAEALGLANRARMLRDLCFPFALWITRQGGEFATLRPVADAVAELANRLSDHDELAALYGLIDELIDAAMPLQGRVEDRDASQPWRVLVLNRAIVATRSLRTALIELAYSSVVELLPEDAPGFFEEAMEQMDAVSYPANVRTVVERHYREHCGHRTLH